MIRTHTCPYCGAFLKMGHGAPHKDIDSPVKLCYHCHQTYIDNNAYEWAVIDWVYKLFYYFLANNRWVPYFFCLIPALGGYWAIPLLIALFWATGCFIAVKIAIADDVELSQKRCLQPGYVDLLVKNYDKVSIKKCEEYKKESIRLQNIGEIPKVEPVKEPTQFKDDISTENGNVDNDNSQLGEKCELCGSYVDHLTYCEIKDDFGTRYRSICDDCITKNKAKPKK